VIKALLNQAPYFVIIAVAGSMLALSFIEVVDLFLLWTVFLIIALGLYELFISSDLKLPGWLVIRTLDDLEVELVGVVIVARTWFLKSASKKPSGKYRGPGVDETDPGSNPASWQTFGVSPGAGTGRERESLLWTR
jgi:hypothetical protein